MGSLAMKATERDPDFLANFEAALGKNKRKQGEREGRQGGWCCWGWLLLFLIDMACCINCPACVWLESPAQSSSAARWEAPWTPWCESSRPARARRTRCAGGAAAVGRSSSWSAAESVPNAALSRAVACTSLAHHCLPLAASCRLPPCAGPCVWAGDAQPEGVLRAAERG